MKRLMQIIHKRGFTLIETLVAIAILVTATAGPMVVASQGAQLGRHSRDQMIASYLAQDAIEYVRYVIATEGNNNVSGSTVLDPISECVGVGSVCYIDTSEAIVASAVSSCTSGSCPDLTWSPSERVYDYGSASTTGFNREVRVRNTSAGPGSSGSLPSDTEYTISVTVWWNNKSSSLEIVNRLVDWRVVF